jgi:GGDEF domain-containing protein
MPDDRSEHRAPRARPLADLPIDALLERTKELARRWAIALVLERSLEGLAEVPLEQIAREAPALCGQLLCALRSDAELDLLVAVAGEAGREKSSMAPRVGALADAHDATAAIGAVEALRGVIWEALLAELDAAAPGASTRRLIEAADRLAHVCSAMLPAALSALGPETSEPASPSLEHDDQIPASALSEPRSGARIVIVDERRHEEQPEVGERERVVAPEPAGPSEIEIRDERDGEGPAAWIGSISRQLERYEEDRLPFAVLLLEVTRGYGVSGLGESLERALASTLRDSGGGALTREREGRHWLLAPRTDRSGAADLAERLSEAVLTAGSANGVELSVSVGTAVCPQDGSQASALAAHADIGLYAARSRSRSGGFAATPVDERS